jgi:hypothetical protein
MPAQEQVAKNVKPLIVTVFTVFCLANILLLVVSLLVAFRDSKLELLPEDVGLGVRILIFAVGAALSWALGRWVYMRMVEGEIRVPESATAALVLLFYLLLTFAGLAFLGGFSWIWQTVFLAILVLMTLLGLSRVIGLLPSILILVLCALAGIALFVMLS